jgi:hypothetical protein
MVRSSVSRAVKAVTGFGVDIFAGVVEVVLVVGWEEMAKGGRARVKQSGRRRKAVTGGESEVRLGLGRRFFSSEEESHF